MRTRRNRRGRGRRGTQKGGEERKKQRVPVFQIHRERKQCDLRVLFSMVHSITSHRRGIIKHTVSG